MNIFVGRLSSKVSSSDLEDLFSVYGAVASARVVKDKETGKPRGFGFVEMHNEEEAKNSIMNLDGKEFMGSSITVISP